MSSRSCAIGDCVLDVERGLLLRAGVEVPLRPKSFDVLRYLVEHRGRLVTRAELLDAVWGKVVVTEGSVAKCLIDIRRAIGDEEQRLIRTIPKRGYLMEAEAGAPATVPEPVQASVPEPAQAPASALAQVSAAETEQVSAPSRIEAPGPRATRMSGGLFRWAAVAAILVAVSGWAVLRPHPPGAPVVGRAEPSVAVLPFADLSQDASQKQVAEGMSEELIDVLTRDLPVPVIARSSSFAFRDRKVSAQDIARQLNVTHLVKGSLRLSDGHAYITAQLIDGMSGQPVWSESFDRAWKEVPAMQQDIARAIASQLQVSFAQASTARAGINPAAYEKFLQGRFFYDRRAPGDMNRALTLFQGAVALEPDYSRAWASLAGTYYILGDTGVLPTIEARAREFEAAQRAVALDPDLAEAHVRLANSFADRGDLTRVKAEIAAAQRADPDSVLLLSTLAGREMMGGRIDAAVAYQRRAVRRDPMSIVARRNLAIYLYCAGRYDEARTQFDTAERMVHADGAVAADDSGIAYVRILVAQSKFAEADAVVQAWPEGIERDYGVALLAIAKKDVSHVKLALDRLEGRMDEARRDPEKELASSLAYFLGELWAYQGDNSRAFDWLERASLLAAGGWQSSGGELRYSPFAAAIRSDPRWNAWLAKQPCSQS